MSDPTDRPVFVWLVLVLCIVYTGFFAFTGYVSARSYSNAVTAQNNHDHINVNGVDSRAGTQVDP